MIFRMSWNKEKSWWSFSWRLVDRAGAQRMRCLTDSESEHLTWSWGIMQTPNFSLAGVPTPLFRKIGMMLEMQKVPQPAPHVIQMLGWFECLDGYIMVLEGFAEPWVTSCRCFTGNIGRLSEKIIRGLFHDYCRPSVTAFNAWWSIAPSFQNTLWLTQRLCSRSSCVSNFQRNVEDHGNCKL